jgi:ribosomal protein S18 acetylase RimI-like enzyme
MKNGFYINTADLNSLKVHFGLVAKEYIFQLNSKVVLDDYIEKIYNNAVLYEFWINDVLVGLSAVYENRGVDKPAYLTNLSIIESEIRKGFATSVLNYTVMELRNKKFTNFLLEVWKNNDTAIRLYEKFGFIIIGEKDVDSWLMQLVITTSLDDFHLNHN